MPEGFEFYEYIHDGRIVFRKRKTSQIRPAERQIVEDAVANLSAATDFIVEAQEKEIVVYLSQFNSIMGQEEMMARSEDLGSLAEICEHIGRDSYFDLRPEGMEREDE